LRSRPFLSRRHVGVHLVKRLDGPPAFQFQFRGRLRRHLFLRRNLRIAQLPQPCDDPGVIGIELSAGQGKISKNGVRLGIPNDRGKPLPSFLCGRSVECDHAFTPPVLQTHFLPDPDQAEELAEADGDTEAEELAEGDREAEGDRDSDGLKEADGLSDSDAEALGLADGLREAEGD
jgi:hypothetical protein